MAGGCCARWLCHCSRAASDVETLILITPHLIDWWFYQHGRRIDNMYAIHFLLFVMTLVLCHIIQSCLKPFAKHGETDQPPDEPQAEEASTTEDDEDCLWSPWSAWSECTVTCGDGISVRHRVTLILGNCTGDMVQERICSEQLCPHEKDFIFRRNDEDIDQSSGNDEDVRPEDVGQNHQHEQTQSDAKTESSDANRVPGSPSGHITGYEAAPNENVNPENDGHGFDERNEQDDDAPRGRGRGQSWTSDDGNPWGHQSSFDSLSHGEEAGEEGFRSGGEEKTEDIDNCFSDCSPTDPPANSFGSERSRTEEEGSRDKAKSDCDENQGGAGSGKTGEGQEKTSGKDDEEKSKNDESLKEGGKGSNDEEMRREVDTDFEDDDNFDDEAEDADDYDDNEDDNDNDESGTGKKQKREHEEEDAEQDDLEQEEEELEKKPRQKKKRRRKRKRKTRENGIKSNDSQVVCDPTELGDTFLAKIECADSVEAATLVASESDKCDYASRLILSDPVPDLTSAKGSELDILEIDEFGSAKESTAVLSESEVSDVANRL